MKPDMISQSLVGFDAIFNLFDNDRLRSSDSNYPPYNLLKIGDNTYRIELAVTGFETDEINVTLSSKILKIEGTRQIKQQPANTVVLHSGLAARNFTRRFALADYIEVTNVSKKNGLLTIDLERNVPDQGDFLKIQINDKE